MLCISLGDRYGKHKNHRQQAASAASRVLQSNSTGAASRLRQQALTQKAAAREQPRPSCDCCFQGAPRRSHKCAIEVGCWQCTRPSQEKISALFRSGGRTATQCSRSSPCRVALLGRAVVRVSSVRGVVRIFVPHNQCYEHYILGLLIPKEG